ncbi:MAG: sulfite exporter TauE/SafE family protein [Proteobacteria bacterium]|nr:sulfite exporter TauE/SafE family protein [Pseudomonadota bacterium]
MEAATIGLAFLAGLLSIASPCVLPLLPVVLGTAVAAHRLGPVALAAGLALSFLVLGLFVATIGFSLGLDGELFRTAAAVLLLVAGLVLVVPALQIRLALAAAPLGNWFEQRFGGGPKPGLAGQFGVGLLLGAVWTPCVGPTLGAASVLAAQGRDLVQVAVTMLVFAIGTALPLLGLGLLSRDALMRWRGRLLATGTAGKRVLGSVLAATGMLILSGYDRAAEAMLLGLAPDWLTDIATRF